MQGQQKQDGMVISNSDAFNILYWGVNVYAMALLPFLRRGMGRRAIGMHGLFAMALILFYAGRMRSPEMIAYFWAWLAMVFWRRVTADLTEQSLYQGWPVITGWLVKDEMLARCAEAIVVFIIGRGLFAWSAAVGEFVTWGSATLVIKFLIESTYLAREEEAFDDARVEMENRTRRLNRRR